MKNEKIEFDLDIFVKELSKFNMNFPTKENPNFRTREYKAKSNLAYNVDDNFIYWKAYTGSLNKEKFIEVQNNLKEMKKLGDMLNFDKRLVGILNALVP